MTSINWGLLQPVDVGGAFQHGLEQGRQRREDHEVKSALSAYAMNPDDQSVFARLATARPELAIQIRQQQQKAQQQQQQIDIQRRAASGDPQARAELAGIDFNAWDKLNDNDRANLKLRTDYIGDAALAISQLPPEQRSAAWDSYTSQAAARGIAGLEGQVGKYSPEALNSALASSGRVKDFLATQKIDYNIIPNGGHAVPKDAQGNLITGGGTYQIGQGGSLSPAEGAAAGPPGQPMTQEQAATSLKTAQQHGFMDGGQFDAMRRAFGANGQPAFQQWMKKNRIGVRGSNGQVAYYIDGKWYDNPEGR